MKLCAYCRKRRATIALCQAELAAHATLHPMSEGLSLGSEVSAATRFVEEFMRLEPGWYIDFPRELVSYERVANWAARARRAVPYRIVCGATALGTRVARPVQSGETDTPRPDPSLVLPE